MANDEFSYEELKESVEKLSRAINDLLELFRTAAQDISHEPAEMQGADIAGKLDKLIEQNKEIAEGIAMLLELHKEHLPRISRQAAIPPVPPAPLQMQQPAFQPRTMQRIMPRPVMRRMHMGMQRQQRAPQMPAPPMPQQAPLPRAPMPQQSMYPKMQYPEPAAKPEELSFDLPALPGDTKEELDLNLGLPENLAPPSTPPAPRKKRRFL